MERRVLVAVFLSFLVVYIWQAFFIKPVPKPAATKPGTSAPAQAGAPGAVEATSPSTPVEAPSSPRAAAVVSADSERDVVVETSDVTAIFTNRGARLKSYRLKHYKDADGSALELVAQQLPSAQPLPFSLRVPDAGMTGTLNDALYVVSGAPAGTLAAPLDLRFQYEDSAGLRAEKQFHFEPASYVVGLKVAVTADGKPLIPTIQWGPGLGDSEGASRSAVPPGALMSAQREEKRIPSATLLKQPSYSGDYEFVGVDDHYFATIVTKSGPVKVTYEPFALPQPQGSTAPPHTLVSYAVEPSGPNPALTFYVGPKDFDQLAKVDRDLVRVINFGMFTVIVVPLLNSLKWINGFVGNYGWSILALTAIINLIILPLRHKSVVSMRKMQEIQPEAEVIKSRYAKLKATDPAKQKMNQELMELYKARGVNPASGCVPMLLPFPILIAFYSLLSTAIELRGAPFMLWIHDLSRPDPYYVTPVLMGISQLWQQWIAPAAGVDPIQRRMMMVMPVIFVFLFITYPAGVALYWLASNLWAIGQQYATNYFIGPPVVHTVRPAAERRVKRVGSGKTDAAAREN